MTEISYSSPLAWPKDWLRTPQNQRGFNNGFKQDMSFLEALTYLEEEINEFQASTVSLSSDVEHIKNNRLRKRQGNDSGVCLKLSFDRHTYLLACDKWAMMEHNIYALHLALRNFRNIENWGIGHLGRILHGFAASGMVLTTQAPVGELESWRIALGLGPSATLEDANATYRRRAKEHGDNQSVLTDLNLAMDEARRFFSG